MEEDLFVDSSSLNVRHCCWGSFREQWSVILSIIIKFSLFLFDHKILLYPMSQKQI